MTVMCDQLEQGGAEEASTAAQVDFFGSYGRVNVLLHALGGDI